jgi:hypothetical protein
MLQEVGNVAGNPALERLFFFMEGEEVLSPKFAG